MESRESLLLLFPSLRDGSNAFQHLLVQPAAEDTAAATDRPAPATHAIEEMVGGLEHTRSLAVASRDGRVDGGVVQLLPDAEPQLIPPPGIRLQIDNFTAAVLGDVDDDEAAPAPRRIAVQVSGVYGSLGGSLGGSLSRCALGGGPLLGAGGAGGSGPVADGGGCCTTGARGLPRAGRARWRTRLRAHAAGPIPRAAAAAVGSV